MKQLFFVTVFLLLALPSQAQKMDVTFPTDTPDPLANLKAGHPKLLATAEQFDAIAKATDDPLRVEVVKRVIASADTTLTSPPIQYKLTGQAALLAPARGAFQRIVICSMAYRLTHDAKYAQRARQEMLNVAKFKDWSPAHYLDVAEITMGVAIGYDWCFDTLSSEDKATIKQALLQKALVFAPEIYGKKATDRKDIDKRFWFTLSPYNWNPVCHGGMLAAALALADEEPALAKQVVQGVRAYMPLALHSYGPDGAWPEGPGYWAYGTNYAALSMAMMDSALGTDFGLSTVEPAFAKTVYYRMQMQSPNGVIFNYADVKTTWETSVAPCIGWLATKFGPPVVATQMRADLERQFKAHAENKETSQYFAFLALWLPDAPKDAGPAPDLDAHFRGEADVAVFRSGWSDPNALYLGFKAGKNGVNHGHLDLGAFLLDADNVRWSAQLGSDNYDLPKYFRELRWTYFRMNNYGQSTIIPGKTLQADKSTAPIYAFATTPERAYALADLSPAYPDVARQMLRGVFMEQRARVLVQDDVTGLLANTPLNWQMVTDAQIAISKSGHTATLTKNGKTLKVRILSPADGTFHIGSATPPTPAEDPNTGYSVLIGTVPGRDAVADVRMGVSLTPVGEKWPAKWTAPKIEPLPVPGAAAETTPEASVPVATSQAAASPPGK